MEKHENVKIKQIKTARELTPSNPKSIPKSNGGSQINSPSQETKSYKFLKRQTEVIDKALKDHLESKSYSLFTSNSVSKIQSKDSIVTETDLFLENINLKRKATSKPKERKGQTKDQMEISQRTIRLLGND